MTTGHIGLNEHSKEVVKFYPNDSSIFLVKLKS